MFILFKKLNPNRKHSNHCLIKENFSHFWNCIYAQNQCPMSTTDNVLKVIFCRHINPGNGLNTATGGLLLNSFLTLHWECCLCLKYQFLCISLWIWASELVQHEEALLHDLKTNVIFIFFKTYSMWWEYIFKLYLPYIIKSSMSCFLHCILYQTETFIADWMYFSIKVSWSPNSWVSVFPEAQPIFQTERFKVQ